MKTIPILTFLTFWNYSISQLNISLQLPSDSSSINGFFYESNSNIIYTGISNQFRIEIPNVKSRDVDLVIKNDNIEFETNWRPIAKGKNWFDPFGEYTRITAQKRGAYFPEESLNSNKYIDTNGIYWEKEYSIKTRKAQELKFTVYVYYNDSSAKIYNTINLTAKHIPQPSLKIEDISLLHPEFTLSPLVDIDFKGAAETFKIKKFTFTAYDKKDNILYQQTCFGNFITLQMSKAAQHKKLSYLELSEIISSGHSYPNIILRK